MKPLVGRVNTNSLVSHEERNKNFPNESHIFKDFLVSQNHQASQQVPLPQQEGSPEGHQIQEGHAPQQVPFIIPNGSFT